MKKILYVLAIIAIIFIAMKGSCYTQDTNIETILSEIWEGRN